jgi:hypothetical protein
MVWMIFKWILERLTPSLTLLFWLGLILLYVFILLHLMLYVFILLHLMLILHILLLLLLLWILYYQGSDSG